MPRVRLTEQMIQAARKPGELWDTDMRDLFLRVQARKKTRALPPPGDELASIAPIVARAASR
jgi:hypothetical protein